MKWNNLGPIIADRLRVTRVAPPSGKVLSGESALDTYDLVEALVESHVDADELEGVGPSSILEQAGLVRPWLKFEWDGLGPTSSGAQIQFLDPGGPGSFARWVTEDADVVIAALEPLSPATATAFLLDLLANNGKSYGVWLFGGLPSRTVNLRPDLIDALALKQCYHAWMEGASERDPAVWVELRDRVIEESEEPDHLTRSKRALEQLKQVSIPGAAKSHRDAQRRAGRDIPHSERERILENYFAVSYRERVLSTHSIESLGRAMQLLATGAGESALGLEYLLRHADDLAASPPTPHHDRLTATLNQAWKEIPRPRDTLVEGLANVVRTEQSLLVVEIAADALALEGEDGATELIALLASEDFAIRSKAAIGLECLGPSRWAVPALVRAHLKEPHEYVAHVIEGALERIGGDDSIKALRRFRRGREG